MPEGKIKVSVFRFDPAVDPAPGRRVYDVPFEMGMSAMDALDYIYQNLDSTLAYYDHAGCALGICGRCTARIDGRPGLLCQTPLAGGDVELDPLSEDKVLRDLVVARPSAEAEPAETGSAGDLDMNGVPIIVRREIEALIAAPLIQAFIEEVGREKALEIAGRVVRELALESGRLMAAFAGGNTMADLQKAIPLFSMGGALEFEVVELSEKRAGVDVTRCRYAEMYREHGLEEFGWLLSCGRDFALMEGFNPEIRFTRTRTIMQGARTCDFRFSTQGD
ncbi:MAG: L-2-amino-thiazoline-4-carboxylic acid hydrolase [Proteobacteria bacterium]|nr:L-2-amino-thiazoline-4-carboxylic acid hydrolase [Pseudomonadota bacterium]